MVRYAPVGRAAHAFLKVGRIKACQSVSECRIPNQFLQALEECPAREEFRTVESISYDCNITKHQPTYRIVRFSLPCI